MYFSLADAAMNIGEGFDMLCTLNRKCLNTHLITWRSPSLDINYLCNVPSGIKIKVARKRNYTPHSIQTFHWATLQIKPKSTQYTQVSRLNKHCISWHLMYWHYCRRCVARWPGWLLTTPPPPPVSSGSGRVSRSSWWTGWSRARSWCWWGWCRPPSPRSRGPRSPTRASSLSPASSCHPLNPTRSRAVWTQTKVGDHFSLFMLDVIIIDDDVDYIFYIVYVQYRPLYNY